MRRIDAGLPVFRLERLMQSTRGISLIFFFVCAVAIIAGQAWAQNPVGEIRGHVTDEHGGAIAGAKVTLVFPDATERTVSTDQQGSYTFRSLVAGSYTLRVLAKGF